MKTDNNLLMLIHEHSYAETTHDPLKTLVILTRESGEKVKKSPHKLADMLVPSELF